MYLGLRMETVHLLLPLPLPLAWLHRAEILHSSFHELWMQLSKIQSIKVTQVMQRLSLFFALKLQVESAKYLILALQSASNRTQLVVEEKPLNRTITEADSVV